MKMGNNNKISKLDDFYSDVIVTAVEGGIGYWSRCSEYVHGYGDGFGDREVVATVMVHELNDECEDNYKAGVKVTTTEIANAMRRIADLTQPLEYALPEWRKRMARALREKDSGDIDAGDADSIMQFTVLGVITYG